MSTPAGWYPDPEGAPRTRWWDGTAWTDDYRDAPAPPTGTAPAAQTSLAAPEGTRTGTVWIWLISIAIPLATVLLVIPYFSNYTAFFTRALPTLPTDSRARETDPEALRAIMEFIAGDLAIVMLAMLGSCIVLGLQVLFAWLDWRELRRRGVPQPFHWAWSFLGFAGTGNLVTIIGRSVVVKRWTGQGLAPLWASIALQIALLIGGVIAAVVWISHIVTTIIATQG